MSVVPCSTNWMRLWWYTQGTGASFFRFTLRLYFGHLPFHDFIHRKIIHESKEQMYEYEFFSPSVSFHSVFPSVVILV